MQWNLRTDSLSKRQSLNYFYKCSLCYCYEFNRRKASFDWFRLHYVYRPVSDVKYWGWSPTPPPPQLLCRQFVNGNSRNYQTTKICNSQQQHHNLRCQAHSMYPIGQIGPIKTKTISNLTNCSVLLQLLRVDSKNMIVYCN